MINLAGFLLFSKLELKPLSGCLVCHVFA
jgi:hypothetical protein